MNLTTFRELPSDSRIWIHGFSKPLTSEQEETVRKTLIEFLPRWLSHGRGVRGDFDILWRRFLVTAGYCPDGISGCSTDSFIHEIKHLQEHHGIDGLDTSLVYYRDGRGEIQSVPHLDFFKLVSSGPIQVDTPVFDTLLSRLSQLRSGEFEKPFSKSWHARVYSVEQSSASG